MTRSCVFSYRGAVALTTALSLALTPAAPLLAAPAPSQAAAAAPAAAKPSATAAPAKAAPAKAATAVPAPVDGGWPRAYTTPSGGHILLYQPQVASWDDQRRVVAYAAVSYEAKGATKPALGSLKVEADTKVAVAERLVNYSVLQVTESNFPTLTKEEAREVVAEHREGDPGPGARDRARSRARERRQEPDPPEERRGREVGSAEDLLQPESRRCS